ncbi:MAG: glycosyltransferase family 4 protein [Elusimicrobia bacterium]|nr:glycosyltransferase family 4 protein [Elusimicrobiota bacterium]
MSIKHMVSDLSVVMISANFSPYMGGAEKQALEVSKGLIKKGVKVLVLTRKLRGLFPKEVVEGVPVLRLSAPGPGPLSSLMFMWFLHRYLKTHVEEYQIIHVHLASSPAVVAVCVGQKLKKKVLVKIGGGAGYSEIARSQKKILGKLKLWIFKNYKPTFIVMNLEQIKELKAAGLEDHSRKDWVQRIPNGVNTECYFPVSSEEKKRLRQILGWEGLVFLFVGRFDSDKRQDEVLETFLKGWSSAVQQGFKGHFFLVGEGPRESKFKEIIHRHGLKEGVKILGRRQEVAALFQAADVFVLPTISEGLSNATLEAMACGLPVLVSQVSGTQELVQEGKQGLLFHPFHSEEVVKHLLDIQRNPDKRSEMGRNARELVREKYDLNQTVNKLLEAYQGPQNLEL